MEDLRKQFGTLEVLRGVHLNVARGEVLCIIGPSGSGKSTPSSVPCLPGGGLRRKDLSGGRPPRTNRAERAAWKRVKGAALRRVQSKVGMVFQQFNLWPHRSALGNIIESLVIVKKLPRPEAEKIADELLAKVGLSDKREEFPSRLSGGQQQRVAIARALAMRPQNHALR